mgnify:CR=1 FL=1
MIKKLTKAVKKLSFEFVDVDADGDGSDGFSAVFDRYRHLHEINLAAFIEGYVADVQDAGAALVRFLSCDLHFNFCAIFNSLQ